MTRQYRSEDPRNETVNCRVTYSEKEVYLHCALLRNMTLSEYMRSLLEADLHRLVEELDSRIP